jgi:single-stranded DNA-binding protein
MRGVETSFTGGLLGPAELRRSRYGRSYLLFNLAVDPGSLGVGAEAVGRPTEVRVQLYGGQLTDLAEQLHQNVRVLVTGRLELRGWAGGAVRSSRLGMVAMSCMLLSGPIAERPEGA